MFCQCSISVQWKQIRFSVFSHQLNLWHIQEILFNENKNAITDCQQHFSSMIKIKMWRFVWVLSGFGKQLSLLVDGKIPSNNNEVETVPSSPRLCRPLRLTSSVTYRWRTTFATETDERIENIKTEGNMKQIVLFSIKSSICKHVQKTQSTVVSRLCN